MNIVLIGFKNCGKTSVGKLLATKLNKAFIDTDHLIEQQYDALTNNPLSVREIYQLEGESFFRELEKEIIANLISHRNAIIATGGGSVLDSENAINLKKHGKLLYLSIPLEILVERNKLHPTPAFLNTQFPMESFVAHYQQRNIIYRKTADFEINAENKSIVALSDEITQRLQYGQ